MLDPKIADLEGKVSFRSNIKDLIILAHSVCKPGQTVEDFVGILQLSTQNDMMLDLLMEKVIAAKKTE